MPELEAVRGELGADGPGFMAISLEEDPQGVEVIADAYGFHGPVALADAEGGLLDPFGVRKVPGLAFVDREGITRFAASGVRSRRFIAEHARAVSR